MAYIGLEPSNSFVSLKRQVITGDGTASYTLDHSVASVNDVAIFVNNVRQDPAGYSISGAALTLGGTIQSSDDCYVIFLGQALQTVTPGGATITGSMLNNSLISDKTALTSEPATTDELLISDAGTLKRIDYSLISNRPAFEAHLSSSQTLTDETLTKIQFDNEIFDTDNCYDNSTNFRFLPTVSGKYFVYGDINIDPAGTSQLIHAHIDIYKNGSAIRMHEVNFNTNYARRFNASIACVIDMNGSSDYLEIFAYGNDSSGNPSLNVTAPRNNLFGAYKLIGV